MAAATFLVAAADVADVTESICRSLEAALGVAMPLARANSGDMVQSELSRSTVNSLR
jgi:hypothetical protein